MLRKNPPFLQPNGDANSEPGEGNITRKLSKFISNFPGLTQGKLTYQELMIAVRQNKIDTIIVGGVDVQGRLVGKRMSGQFFIDGGSEGSQACQFLLATDIELSIVPGFKSANWNTGYNNFVMKPDLSTLRVVPWQEKTALVLCDIKDIKTNTDLPHSPRALLKKQIARLNERGYRANFASEIEFYLFNSTSQAAREAHWMDLKTTSPYHPYMNLMLPQEEDVIRDIRKGLNAAGILVESTMGEYGIGQKEINVRYCEALEMADRHVILKSGCREIAEQHGKTITFMAKYDYDKCGNSNHIHESLWSMDGKTPLFLDENEEFGMSKLMRSWVAGQMKYARDITWFFAPYINSYKRFQGHSFAPTRIAWSPDNRTSAFRLCGDNTKGVRIECRIGGADLNPYLAFSALIAAGLAGIEEGLELGPPALGNIYSNESFPEIPKSMREAIDVMSKSTMLKKAFGEEAMEHFLHMAKWEQLEYDRRVTDWELHCGFDRY